MEKTQSNLLRVNFLSEPVQMMLMLFKDFVVNGNLISKPFLLE